MYYRRGKRNSKSQRIAVGLNNKAGQTGAGRRRIPRRMSPREKKYIEYTNYLIHSTIFDWVLLVSWRVWELISNHCIKVKKTNNKTDIKSNKILKIEKEKIKCILVHTSTVNSVFINWYKIANIDLKICDINIKSFGREAKEHMWGWWSKKSYISWWVRL